MYQPRTYRYWIKSDNLVSFNVTVKETDLCIRAAIDLSRKARKSVFKYRNLLESYIQHHPEFITSLEPLEVGQDAPIIIKDMARSTAKVGVGPMAAVAGAIAEFVGKELLPFTADLIIENGGDIFLRSRIKRTIGIYAGSSPLSGKIGLEIEGGNTPLGICTSSGTIGHSLSFGKADA
ncbi:UPF0280 family protein, partial [Chloroflexota bacterium]